MDIFSALIKSHEVQRDLCNQIEAAKDTDQKQALLTALIDELAAHAAAEERHLYVPVMAFDDGLELSRHAIAEHHEMDEMVEDLEEQSGDEWAQTVDKLIDYVRHHLEEEEDEFFGQAKKLLPAEQVDRLGALYVTEHEAFKDEHGED